MDNFDHCFSIVLGAEGGFTANPADPGNWTGGRVGQGTCKGTKFGISAAAYPTLDIASLTPAEAKALYRANYWDKLVGDRLPPVLALIVFDAAVNNGRYRAAVWLQQAAGVTTDGVIGPMTLNAIRDIAAQPNGRAALCSGFLAQRLMFMVALPTWSVFGSGWDRRLFRLPYESLRLGT